MKRITFLLGVACLLAYLCLTIANASQPAAQANLASERRNPPNSVSANERQLSANELYDSACEILESLRSMARKPAKPSTDYMNFDYGVLYILRAIFRMLVATFAHRSYDGEADSKTAYVLGEDLQQAIEMLEKAGLEMGHDDALYMLAEINFYAKYTHPRNLTAAFHYYRELATRSGNGTAQHMIGLMYATGIGEVVQRDQGAALLYHSFAAHNGDTAAEMTLAYRYLAGIGVERRCKEAVTYYKRVALKAIAHYESGPPGGRQLPRSKIRLSDQDGGVYGHGASGSGSASLISKTDSVPWEDILEYYRYLADHGDYKASIKASLNLGKLFYQGTREIPQDFIGALHYLEHVARAVWSSSIVSDLKQETTNAELLEKGAKAAGTLGLMYWRGEGVPVSNRTAFYWFMRGATLHNPTSLNALGQMYLHGLYDKQGEIIKKNIKHARNYTEWSAQLEYPDAQVNLALMYIEFDNDYISAYKWFEAAALKVGHFLAHFWLAKMYDQGLGVQPSCTLAAAYYKNVVERGDWLHSPFPTAYEAYTLHNMEDALLHYLIAAERGYEIGQTNVAWLLDQDKSCWSLLRPALKRDPAREKLALIYWTRAANQGNVDARVKMGDYYYKGLGTKTDYEKAAVCYRIAAELDSSAMAMWNLGWMYENGNGLPKDFHLAKRWYDHSFETNKDAYLPVTLSLIKLYVKSFWSLITGSNNNSGSHMTAGLLWDNMPTKSQSGDTSAGGTNDETGVPIEQVYHSQDVPPRREGQEDDIGPNLVKEYNQRKKEDEHHSDDNEQQSSHYKPSGDHEDLVENLIIVVMCMLVGWLVYIRQLRWNQENNQGAARNGEGAGGNAGEGVYGVLNDGAE